MAASNYPPCNQEAISKQKESDEEMNDSDLDYLDLTDVDSGSNCFKELDIAYNAIGISEDIHNKRLVLAKAREWLVFANNSNRNPPFCYIKMRCTPDLGDKQAEERFQSAVQNAYDDARKSFIQKTIETLDQIIHEKTEEITAVRKNAIEEIGTLSKGAGEARKTLYRKLGELKDSKDNELKEYKGEIRANKYTVEKRSDLTRPRTESNATNFKRGGDRGRGRNGRRW